MARAPIGFGIREAFVVAASRLGSAVGAVLVLPLFALGCGQTEVSGDALLGMSEEPPEAVQVAEEACESGATRDCYLSLGRDGDFLYCYEGTVRCAEGMWGECLEGSTVEVPIAAGAGLANSGFLALSAPQDCVGNPCNPFCRRFLETPSAPIELSGGDSTGFRSGDPDSVPEQGSCNWGQQCQDNQLCSAPLTASACAHSKCLTGAALSSACRTADSCVDRICADTPSCCSSTGSWTSTCVGKVKTVCDAFCATPTTVACGHHVCDQGVALTCSNSCVSQVCAADSTCCTNSWAAQCVALATSKCGSVTTTTPPAIPSYSSLCGYSAYAYNDLQLGQQSTLSGLIGAGANLSVTQGNLTGVDLQVKGNLVLDNSTVSGRATVQGTVEFRNTVTFSNPASTPVLTVGSTTTIAINSSRLTGDVVSNNAPKYNGSNATPPIWVGSRITPTSAPNVARPAIPTKSGLTCNSGLTSYTANPGQTIDLAPGNYGSITLNSSSSSPAILKLREGSYTFYNVTFNADSRVDLTYGTAGIDVNVCNTFNIGNRTKFNPMPSSFKLLRWYFAGTNLTVDQQGGTNNALAFPGVLIAPNAAVTVAPNTRVQGVVYAKSLRFEPGLVILPSDYATTMCGSTSPPACDPGISMTANPTVSETGTCEHWDEGATDASCAGYDLALGVPCEDSVVVCNHGKSAAPANVRLAFFDTTYPWANTSPNLTDPAHRGDCYTASVVPAGQCISQACDPALLDRELEIVAIPPSTSPIECSTLENWAHYHTATACACFWGEIASADVAISDPTTCRVPLGTTATLDFEAIEVSFISASGVSTMLARRTSSTDCVSGGWYLDGSDVALCSTTCNTLDTAAGARAKVSVGCPSAMTAEVVTQTYESDCDSGQLAQWNMLNWSSSTPSNSQILFEVRTARNVASLASETFQELGVARNDGTIDTQICDPFNTSAECPAMFSLLVEDGLWEMSDLRQPVLELRATLTPSSGLPAQGPALSGWEAQFSCLDSE